MDAAAATPGGTADDAMPLTVLTPPRVEVGANAAPALRRMPRRHGHDLTMTRTKATTSKERRYEHPRYPRTSAEAFLIGPNTDVLSNARALPARPVGDDGRCCGVSRRPAAGEVM